MCYDISRYNMKGYGMTTFVLAAPGCRRGDQVRFMTGRHRRGRSRHFGSGHGFGRRAGRGDIRAAILSLLAEQPMHGYQIIQELSERTGGVWRPSPGSVYPTLQQLEDEELVRETAGESGKRVYELTDAGREQASSATEPWTAVTEESDDALVALRDLAHHVLAATRQVAHAGTTAQVEAAQEVLRDARRSLYRLLADED
jgi:DNA-binding PadR family transcriptional regulator